MFYKSGSISRFVLTTILIKLTKVLIGYTVKENYEDSPTAGFMYSVSEEKKEEPSEDKDILENPGVNVPKTLLKAGTIFTGKDGTLKYKVTKVSDGKHAGQVQVVGIAKTKAKMTIPATVTAVVTEENFMVTSIGAKAFKGNKKITSVTVGKNVKLIGANAFSGCGKLKTMTLGAGVVSIGSKAFYKCVKLKKIVLKSAHLEKIGKNAISGIYRKAVIKVPAKKQKAYNKKFNKKTGRKATVKVVK